MIWWRYIDGIVFIWEHGEESTDTHEFLDSTSCHPYHCKKSIPYSQVLRYNRICSDNKKFDQRCNDLEKWLMERGYSERMVRTQMLKARGGSRDSLLERGNTKTSDSKLTFNITYYPAFQNVRSILEELEILLAQDKEHKKVFPEVPVVRFRNGKTLKDYLVRTALPKMDNVVGSEPCGKGTCQVCDHIITTKTFIQDWHRGIDDWKVTYLRSVKPTNNLKKGRRFDNTN